VAVNSPLSILDLLANFHKDFLSVLRLGFNDDSNRFKGITHCFRYYILDFCKKVAVFLFLNGLPGENSENQLSKLSDQK